jgi:peptidoglycan-associated lipoprotein
MGGRWGQPEKIELGPDSLVFAHPAISPDGNTLYFVSDMPGGKGGQDIWQIRKKSDGSWGVPVNLGPDVNTSGDEMFPYVRTNGGLYFSSNGLIGYGGLDLFEASEIEKEGWMVRNMGAPVNSTGDDFGIVFRGAQESGFFSSNRNSSKGVDDIFAFERPLIIPTLKGRVLNQEGLAVEGALLRIVGNNGTNVLVSVQPDGKYEFKLEPDVSYVMMASAPDYLNKKEKVSTSGLVESRTFERSLVLESARSAILFYDIRYSPGEIEVSSQAQENLNRVARLLTSNPLYSVSI